MPAEDLRPLFTERTAARVKPALRLQLVTDAPRIVLDPDTIGLLRDGLGWFDMEIRWLAHLDRSNVLRLWRSWIGIQIYEVHVGIDAFQTNATLSRLMVEQSPERYTRSLAEEPALFERVLISTVNHVRRFRAGHTPYGPSPGAGPEPQHWPPDNQDVGR